MNGRLIKIITSIFKDNVVTQAPLMAELYNEHPVGESTCDFKFYSVRTWFFFIMAAQIIEYHDL